MGIGKTDLFMSTKNYAKPVAIFTGIIILLAFAFTVFAATSEDQSVGTSMTVNGFVDTSSNCSSFSFGSLDPGTSDNAAAGNPPCTITNTANSNVAVDIYLNASNMTNGGNWISFRNLSVWTADAAASSVPLNATNMGGTSSYLNGTTADTGFIEDLAVSGTVDFYFWQDVPTGQAPGSYSADLTIHSMQSGIAP